MHITLIKDLDWVAAVHTSSIPALGSEKPVDPCEFEASLVYIVPGQLELHSKTQL